MKRFSCFNQSQSVSAFYAKLLSIVLSVKLYSTNMEDDERVTCITCFCKK